jgi:hypothetical protein
MHATKVERSNDVHAYEEGSQEYSVCAHDPGQDKKKNDQ